jgi:hypothetical protein
MCRTTHLWQAPRHLKPTPLPLVLMAMLTAIRLLGESLDAMAQGFALLVVPTAFMGQRTSHAPNTRSNTPFPMENMR